MSIADKLTTIAENLVTIGENEQKVYDAGYEKGNQTGNDNGYVQAYDDFWTAYHTNTEMANGRHRFYGWEINEKTFRPQKDFTVTDFYRMFRGTTGEFDLVELCEKRGVKMVLKAATINSSMEVFGSSSVVRIGEVDLSVGTGNYWQGTFERCTKLHTIEKLVLSEKVYPLSMFTSCFQLQNLTIEGTIGENGFNVQWSTKLSKASITSIINALSETTSGLTVTLSKTAVNNAFGINVDDATTWGEGTEYYTLRHSKDNWSISYI